MIRALARKRFLGAFFSAKPGVLAQKTGLCGAKPGLLRVPRGFDWRALESLFGGVE